MRKAYLVDPAHPNDTKMWKELDSLEGKVINVVSEDFSRRIVKLTLGVEKKETGLKHVEVILEGDAPRIDVGEAIRVHYNSASTQHEDPRVKIDRYFGGAVEILDAKGNVKFSYLDKYHVIKKS